MNRTDKLLLANLAAVLILAFAVVSDKPVQVTEKDVVIEKKNVTHNLACPRAEPNVTVENYPRNIQNPEINPSVELSGDTFKVEDVDSYGQLYGSSMYPSVMDEDILLYKKYTGERDLESGLIIRYKIGKNQYEIHRIVGDYTEQGYVVTSGDRFKSWKRVPVGNVTHVVKGVIYN